MKERGLGKPWPLFYWVSKYWLGVIPVLDLKETLQSYISSLKIYLMHFSVESF